MIKVSVIIPVYNAEQYITKCLESLLGQTLSDMEIMVVDDRGTDGSMDKVRAIMQNNTTNKHIRIVEMPENSGAWAARNAGMKLAIGEYVGFVDADDWCEPCMFDVLYNSAINIDADWSYGNTLKHAGNGKEISLRQKQIKNGLLDEKSRKDVLINHVALFWSGIYRRGFLQDNQIIFPESRFSEDSYFFWMVVMHAQRISSVDAYLYHYVEHSSSVSRMPDRSKAFQKINLFKALRGKLMSEGLYNDYAEEIDYLCLKKGYIIPMIIETINNYGECKETICGIRKELNKEIPNIYDNVYFKRDCRSAILLYMFKYMPVLMSKLLRVKYKRDPF